MSIVADVIRYFTEEIMCAFCMELFISIPLCIVSSICSPLASTYTSVKHWCANLWKTAGWKARGLLIVDLVINKSSAFWSWVTSWSSTIGTAIGAAAGVSAVLVHNRVLPICYLLWTMLNPMFAAVGEVIAYWARRICQPVMVSVTSAWQWIVTTLFPKRWSAVDDDKAVLNGATATKGRKAMGRKGNNLKEQKQAGDKAAAAESVPVAATEPRNVKLPSEAVNTPRAKQAAYELHSGSAGSGPDQHTLLLGKIALMPKQAQQGDDDVLLDSLKAHRAVHRAALEQAAVGKEPLPVPTQAQEDSVAPAKVNKRARRQAKKAGQAAKALDPQAADGIKAEERETIKGHDKPPTGV